MTTTYFIAGSAFLLLSITWGVIKWKSGRKRKYEQAVKDHDAAVDRGDWAAIDDSRRRMSKFK